MSDTPKKEPLPSSPIRQSATEVLPDHLFSRMQKMLVGSLNNLPTPLVLILIFSLLAAVLTGLGIKFLANTPTDPFMRQRLSADSSAPALDPARLEGNWTASADGKAMTLRLEKETFEWVVKTSNNEFERVFARGNFRTVGNVLILGPRDDMGKPATTLDQGLVFLPMGLNSLNVKAEENGRLMVWLLPSSERRRVNTNIKSFFPAEAEKPLTWVRM